jgi:hypothetical protein
MGCPIRSGMSHQQWDIPLTELFAEWDVPLIDICVEWDVPLINICLEWDVPLAVGYPIDGNMCRMGCPID